MGGEDEGNKFIQDIKKVEVDAQYILARWSSKAKPRTPSMIHKIRNTGTGPTQEWRPIRGLMMDSAQQPQEPHQGQQELAQQVRHQQEVASEVSITYTPDRHSQATGVQAPSAAGQNSNGGGVPQHDAQLSLWDSTNQDNSTQVAWGARDEHQQEGQTHGQSQELAHNGQIQVHGGQETRAWNKHDTFQAILQQGDRVLLTTYHQEESEWLVTTQVNAPQEGSMWDYHVMPTQRIWIAGPSQTQAVNAQEWLFQARRGEWVGAQYIVIDPDKIHMEQATHGRHKAFLRIRQGQQLTALSPPVWVWSDHTQLAGLWCLLMTTYNTNVNEYIPMTQVVVTGLVPMSTLKREDDE